MEKKEYQGYLLAQFTNIHYISNYRPTSFAFCVIKEDPIIYASKMDMEIANKTSTIEVKKNLLHFQTCLGSLKRKEFPIWLLELSLVYSTYEKFKDSFNIKSETFIDAQRQIKTNDEIDKIQKATQIAQKAFVDLDILNNTKS